MCRHGVERGQHAALLRLDLMTVVPMRDDVQTSRAGFVEQVTDCMVRGGNVFRRIDMPLSG